MDPAHPTNTSQAHEEAQAADRTFEFISLTNTHRINENDHHAVRKHAMRSNTNRRHKRKELSAKVVKRDVSRLTSPSVAQQALQTKRFQLLPRALQDLEDKSKMEPVPGNLKRLGSHVGGGKGFESASSRGGQDDSIGKLSVELGLLDESSTIQYHLYYPGLARLILDPLMAYLPYNTPCQTRLLIQHNCMLPYQLYIRDHI
ncbi:uncharacterized protein RSE6_06107 [Rhynchosporium secalis]|uniref:Uncharacterized protein n=1 Tax=Rhynchosporium secalis TaxID=38038 RepID=A0A1E1MAN5_RHYSE|nr:uncharacterized protein RSE6_06107 [Rhynchosporium secalis]